MTEKHSPLTEAALRQFTGTERWFCHPLARAVLYTEGAHYVAEKGAAYWLLDSIALAQKVPGRRRRVLPALDAHGEPGPDGDPHLRGRRLSARAYPVSV